MLPLLINKVNKNKLTFGGGVIKLIKYLNFTLHNCFNDINIEKTQKHHIKEKDYEK